jgi:hypothetical protein
MSREPGNLPRAVVLLSVGVRRELRYYRGDDSWSRYYGTTMPYPCSAIVLLPQGSRGDRAGQRIVVAALRVSL